MSALTIHESFPYQEEVDRLFRQLHESYMIARNATGSLIVWLLYRGRFYALGSPGSIAYLSHEALSETIAMAKRHEMLGYEQLTNATPVATGGAETGELTVAPPAPLPVPPEWLQNLRPQRPVPRHTVPQARLQLPVAVLQQLLQLPAGYQVKQVAVEEDGLHIYCLTPECAAMDASQMSGNPVLHADYQLEERDGRQWRALVSVRVEPVSL